MCEVRYIFYYFKHKKTTSQTILAQLEKKCKLVKASLWQLTQDQDKDSRVYYDKTFYIAAKLTESILWSLIPKLKHMQFTKSMSSIPMPVTPRGIESSEERGRVHNINKMQQLPLALRIFGIQKPAEIVV